MSTKGQFSPFFTPTQISGCTLWLDAADTDTITLSGTNVIEWRDKSQIRYNFTQATTINQPTYVRNSINNLNALSFVGPGTLQTTSSQFLDNSSFVLTQGNYSIFVIARQNSSSPSFTGYNYILKGNNTQDSFLFFGTSSAKFFATFTGPNASTWNDTDPNIPNITTTSTTLLLGMTVSGSVLIPYYNGNSMNTKVGTTGAFTGMRIGDAPPGFTGQCWNGLVSEIVIYNGTLNTIQRQQLEGYLAWKWGLQSSLPSNHPYRSSPIPPLLSPPIRAPTMNEIWNPRKLPGCAIWLDCSDPTTLGISNGVVSTWRSKGNASLTATSVGGGSILYSNFNNLPALYFNGSSTRMTTNSIPSYGTTGTTWLTVSVNLTPVTTSTPVDASVTFATLSGTSPEKSIRYNFTPQFVIYTFNNGQIRGGRANNNNGIRGFIDSGASMYAFANGTDFTESQLTATYQPGVNQAFQLGQWNTGWLLGFIQEVIVYDSALTIAQYQFVEGYLAWKWGFQASLTGGHPYRNTPPVPITPIVPYTPRSNLSTRSWLPTQISGCAVWLDAADTSTLSLSGLNVTSWTDKASSIVFTTQGTVANAILLNGINNRQCVYFDNSTAENIYMSATLSSRITGSFFYVIQARTQRVDNYRPFATWFNGGGNFPAFGYIGGTGNNNTVGPYTTYIGPGSPTQIFSPNTNYLVFYGFNNGTTSVGISGSTPTAGSQGGFSAAGTTSTFWLGVDGTAASQRVTLYYGEVLLYNSVLNTQQRQQVEGYLAWKWGLQGQLPSTHPFARWPPSP